MSFRAVRAKNRRLAGEVKSSSGKQKVPVEINFEES